MIRQKNVDLHTHISAGNVDRGPEVPYFVVGQPKTSKEKMIEAATVRAIVGPKIEADGNFIVEITVSADNDIRIVVDGDNGIPISYCEELDAMVETSLNRDEEDYSLEVSSAGIGCELKIPRQFQKNIGNQVEVTLPNGSWMRGTLISSDEKGFEVEVEEKRKVEGEKKKQTFVETRSYAYGDVKSVKDIVVL